MEGDERLVYEKKRKIREALQGLVIFFFPYLSKQSLIRCVFFVCCDLGFYGLTEGRPIPTELRNEEARLRQEIDLEDQNTAGKNSGAKLFRLV